jgi:hypothetical protein
MGIPGRIVRQAHHDNGNVLLSSSKTPSPQPFSLGGEREIRVGNVQRIAVWPACIYQQKESAMARYLEDFKPSDRYETASIELTEEMIF